MKLLKNKYFWIAVGGLIVLAFILWATGVFETKTPPLPPVTPAIPTTPTDPNTYGGGFKWDAIEKKCYGNDANGRAWVSDDECKKRNLV